MKRMATHNSATGEKGKGLISWLVTPFSRTQSKTIAEQYVAGCRSFDLRIKKVEDNWHCAHGIWTSKRTFVSIIEEINSFPCRCDVSLTYEGRVDNNDEIISLFNLIRGTYKHINWGELSVKYGKDAKGVRVKYDKVIDAQPEYRWGRQGFLPLDGYSWHTYIPIPWLWDMIYTRPHVFNEDVFTFVDFL